MHRLCKLGYAARKAVFVTLKLPCLRALGLTPRICTRCQSTDLRVRSLRPPARTMAGVHIALTVQDQIPISGGLKPSLLQQISSLLDKVLIYCSASRSCKYDHSRRARLKLYCRHRSWPTVASEAIPRVVTHDWRPGKTVIHCQTSRAQDKHAASQDDRPTGGDHQPVVSDNRSDQ